MPTRKLIASAITGAVVFAITKFVPGVDLDTELEQAINVLAMLAAGYLTKNQTTPTGDGVPAPAQGV
jgi:hypothetical protein